MPITFLLDENVPARLWHAIQRHNATDPLTINVVCIGESPDLPLSADDATVLQWAERCKRILVSLDKHTLPGHLESHLQSGRHSPGVFLIRPSFNATDLVEHLMLVAHASEPYEWEDRIEYIPS